MGGAPRDGQRKIQNNLSEGSSDFSSIDTISSIGAAGAAALRALSFFEELGDIQLSMMACGGVARALKHTTCSTAKARPRTRSMC